MPRSSVIRAAYILGFATCVPALLAGGAGCQSKHAAVEDASPATVAPPASSPSVIELAPLTSDDAGFDAGEFDAGKKAAPSGGGGLSANQIKVKQCCAAIRSQAKQLGTSPEATQLTAFAMQCDMMAAQVGPQGTAPEFNQIRAILKSVKLPSACAF